MSTIIRDTEEYIAVSQFIFCDKGFELNVPSFSQLLDWRHCRRSPRYQGSPGGPCHWIVFPCSGGSPFSTYLSSRLHSRKLTFFSVLGLPSRHSSARWQRHPLSSHPSEAGHLQLPSISESCSALRAKGILVTTICKPTIAVITWSTQEINQILNQRSCPWCYSLKRNLQDENLRTPQQLTRKRWCHIESGTLTGGLTCLLESYPKFPSICYLSFTHKCHRCDLFFYCTENRKLLWESGQGNLPPKLNNEFNKLFLSYSLSFLFRLASFIARNRCQWIPKLYLRLSPVTRAVAIVQLLHVGPSGVK